jgi:hypothetical protein
MRVIALLVLLAIVACCFADVSLDVNYGATVHLQSNVTTTLSIKRGPLLDVESTIELTSDRDVTITVEKHASLRVKLPTQYQLIQVGSTVGFVINKNDSDAQISVTYNYKLSVLAAAALQLLTNFKADAVQYDASADAYFALNAEVTGGDTLSFYPLDRVGNFSSIEFYIVAFDIRVPRIGLFNRWLLFRKNAQQAAYKFGESLTMNVTAQSDVYITASQPNNTNTHPTVNPPSANAQAITFISFHAEDARTKGQAAFEATFSYAYDAAALAANNINATTIRFAKFVNGAWQYQEGTKVDVSANVVVHSTTSFSDWAAYAETNQIADSVETSAASVTSYSLLAIVATLVIALFC